MPEQPAWRFYLLPVETVGLYCGPKYFAWRYDPDPPGIDTLWSLKRYYLRPAGLLCGHMNQAEHQALRGQRDVHCFGALDAAIDLAGLSRVYRKSGIPFGWAKKKTTNRQALRFTAAMFGFCEELQRYSGQPQVGTSAAWRLDAQWAELSGAEKEWITEAARRCGYSLEFVRVRSTVADVVCGMAAQWGKRNVFFRYVNVDYREGF